MKNVCLILTSIFFFVGHLISQNEGYIWVTGHDSYTSNANFGGITINFNNDTLIVSKEDRYMDFGSGVSAGICSPNGQLLVYSNGCTIANSENLMVENGDSINFGDVFSIQCDPTENSGYTSGTQSAIMLPLPGSGNLIYLFHKRIFYSFNPFDVRSKDLLYSIIEVSANNDLGKVITKNQIACQDSFAFGDMTAVRHANGEDWWLVSPGDRNNKYFIFKFDAAGISLIHELALGDPTPSSGEGGGQVLFSPDGSKYIRYNPKNKIRMFDFDRSTGLLSNYQNIDVDFGDFDPFDGGMAISPNGQYLYITAKIDLYQLDLFAADISASQTLIGEYDGYGDPLATNFGSGIMGPDCKLYIFPGNDSRAVHVIHNPNEAGAACNFDQRGLPTPSYHGATFPNFPNFRLGALGEPVSPCAGYTVNSTEAPVFNTALPLLSVFPNPASSYVRVLPNVVLPDGALWSLYDGLGRRVRTVLPGGVNEAVELSTQNLPTGLYLWELQAVDGRRLGSGKLVVR